MGNDRSFKQGIISNSISFLAILVTEWNISQQNTRIRKTENKCKKENNDSGVQLLYDAIQRACYILHNLQKCHSNSYKNGIYR